MSSFHVSLHIRHVLEVLSTNLALTVLHVHDFLMIKQRPSRVKNILAHFTFRRLKMVQFLHFELLQVVADEVLFVCNIHVNLDGEFLVEFQGTQVTRIASHVDLPLMEEE